MDDEQWAVRVAAGYRVGPWRITRGLASGSWSSVYAAERDSGGPPPTQAALKFIPTGTLTSRQLSHLADMTDRELAAHRKLSHPNLIKVWETLVVDDPAEPTLDGATVLAMELAERSAAQALAGASGGLPDAPRIIVEICAGLAHLHKAGWVHGDLKPSNVLLMADGSVRLADFGLSAQMDGTHAYLPPGGTADYMPPERWLAGNDPGGAAIRQTADIWALGVTACRLLTAGLPFPGVTARARMAAAASFAAGRTELTLPSGLTPDWRQFIVDCLAPSHAARSTYSATSLLTRAREAAGGGSPAGRPGRRWRRSLATGPRRVLLAGAMTVSLVAAAGSLAAFRPWQQAAEADASRRTAPDYARYFRTDRDIPPRYYDLIVRAGTSCPADPEVTPHLVAALLKAESNFDPDLSDPAKNEFGIARWTPRVLQYYLPSPANRTEPKPPLSPEVSIPMVGEFLCRFAPRIRGIPGDPVINLVAVWRTSEQRVREAKGVPDRVALREYMPRLRANIAAYRPTGLPSVSPT